jgi:acetoin:2,6-dichlorophenolindophenol oxidoreductase subunit alpha
MSQVAGRPRTEEGSLPDERLLELLREMLLIRRFEEKVEERFRAGELPGFLHVAIGQEAIASGVCAALEADDVIASTHRAHGHTIAKGTNVNAIMAELYGKTEGCSKGFGGSMHLYDVERGNLGANAVVGGGLPQIVGAALAFKLRKEARVGVAFFGDGATNTGAFHESMNLAQLWQVPALFVLENNGWAESTPASQQLPLPQDELSKRALAYGMKTLEADGQDVVAVHDATREAREHAVSGGGPVFLHMRTHRLTGHYVGDPQVYREKDEVRKLFETKDPIELLRARLGINGEEFDRIDAEVTAEVEEAVELAKNGTDPQPEDALKWVYADEAVEAPNA